MTGTAPARHWLDPPDWWRKYRPLRWLAAALLIVALVLGLRGLFQAFSVPAIHPQTAEFTARVSDPVTLPNALRSYQSVSDVTARLQRDGYEYRVANDHAPPSPRWPPRDLDAMTVEAYRHLGQKGKLTLSFFNDRLYEAYFVPDDAAAYASRLHKALPGLKRDRASHAQLVRGALRVTTNIDAAISPVGRTLDLNPYVQWQDQRLVRQRRAWDAEFGALLVSAGRR